MRLPALILACAGLAAPCLAQPPGTDPASEAAAPAGPALEFTSGAQYDEGDYGTGSEVRKVTADAGLRGSAGRWGFSATLPWLHVDAPANVVGGGGLLGLPIIIDPNRPSTRDRREGIGDLRLEAAYSVPVRAVALTLSGHAKVPTASRRKGLGTGELDYGIGAELAKPIGPVIPFAGVAYTVVGDPDGFDLRNSVSGRAGAALQMSPALRAHVSYGYAQSPSRLVADEQQIATGLNAGLTGGLSLGIYGAAGLSEGSPDISAGLRFGFRLR